MEEDTTQEEIDGIIPGILLMTLLLILLR